MGIKYDNTNNDFFNNLTSEVEKYFQEKKIKKTGDRRLYLKASILIGLFIFLYIKIVFFTPHNHWIALGLCAVLGIVVAGIGFNIMHDSSHGAYSSKKWVNKTMFLTLDIILGLSGFMWMRLHVYLHHFFTNTDYDSDIQFYPLLAIHPKEKTLRFHKYQAWYAPALYAILYFLSIIYFDFFKYFLRNIGSYKIKNIKLADHLLFRGGKLFYVFYMIVVPAYIVGIGPTLIGYFVLSVVCSLMVFIIFQLSHVVQETWFEEPDQGKITTPWAIVQIQETINFANHNKIITWCLGGLNFQLFHHLLPKVSHIHYPDLIPVINKVCQTHNLSYKNLTFLGALRSHFRFLNQRRKQASYSI